MLLLEPRFWAEEGSIHFAYAMSHDGFRALAFVPLNGGPAGYFNLVPNLATWIAARCVALELAPLVTTLCALAVQLVPFAIVVWGRSLLWTTVPQRVAAGLLLVLSPCVVSDVWINTINSQVFLGLVTLLILCERLDDLGRIRRYVYRGLLVLAGVTGVYTAVLAPAAVFRAYRVRGREACIHAALIVAAVVLQAGAYGMTDAAAGLDRQRFAVVDWGRTLAFAAYHSALRPLLGDAVGGPLTTAIGLREALGGPDLWQPLHGLELPGAYSAWAAVLSVLAVAGLLAILGRPRRLEQQILLAALVSLWLVVVPATAPAVVRLRYAVLPGLVVVLLALQTALRGGPAARVSARLLLAICLLTGIGDFRREIIPGAFGQLANRPDWTEEVARWRSQPRYPPRIWPYSEAGSWRLRLLRPGSEPAAAFELIAGDAVQLVTNGPRVEAAFPVERFPADFKMVVVLDSTRPADEVDLSMELLDDRGRPIVAIPIGGFEAGRQQRLLVWEQELRSPRRALPESVDQVVLRMSAPLRSPVRVRIHQLTVSYRLEGLLDRLAG